MVSPATSWTCALLIGRSQSYRLLATGTHPTDSSSILCTSLSASRLLFVFLFVLVSICLFSITRLSFTNDFFAMLYQNISTINTYTHTHIHTLTHITRYSRKTRTYGWPLKDTEHGTNLHLYIPALHVPPLKIPRSKHQWIIMKMN